MTPKLTAVGKNLLLRALAGETIKFTSVQLGNGAEQTAESATMLSNPLLTASVSNKIDAEDKYVILSASFTNETITSGFHITEAGFFAEDPDDPSKEILYALENEDESTADYMPDNTSRVFEMQYDALIFIGDAENVTTALNSSLVYVSKADFDNHVNDKQNPHEVTKEQVGLGNVPNVSTNDQTPTYSDIKNLETIASGEKISTVFAKIKLAISSLINHLADSNNPHKVTAKLIGAAATSHTHSVTDMNSGTLSVLRGGTGATTAAKARANLEAFGVQRLLTSADNLDNITDNGIYYYYSSSIPKNAPYQAAAIVEVIGAAATNSAKVQRVTRYAESGYTSERSLNNGTWFDWSEIVTLNSDSSWKPLSLINGAKGVDYGGRSTPSYRKIGNHVYIEGAISLTIPNNQAHLNIASLPSGYRPKNIVYALAPCQGYYVARLLINSNGTCQVEWLTRISDGVQFHGEVSWVQFKMDYFVD